MSTSGNHNKVVLVGDVREVSTDENGALIVMILLVDVGEVCEVSVMFPTVQPGVSVGDRL
jgi:hypothetical protein